MKGKRLSMDLDRNHHAYHRDPQSGAGNCVCGHIEAHGRHPHEFRRARNNRERCTCGGLPEHEQHLRWMQSGRISADVVTPKEPK